MILTGKCKEKFLEWKVNNKNLFTIEVLDFKHLSPTSQNALIIEFFDSVGVIIVVHNVCDDWWYRVKSKPKILKSERYNDLKSRQEATEKAIKDANEIYNEMFK